MPEGPECRMYSEFLNRSLQGRHTLQFRFLSGRYANSSTLSPVGYNEFNRQLPLTVSEVRCYGKFIYWEFTNKTFLWNTLGMTGSWSESKDNARLEVIYQNEFQCDHLYYSDPRNFGTFHFNKTRLETSKKVESLGYDLLKYQDSKDLGGVFPCDVIFSRKRNKSKTLAEILMSQTDYAGIGNYLKAEILYRAKLSPHRLGKDVNWSEASLLDKTIREVMMEAYQAKGGYGGDFEKVIYKRSHCPLGHEIKDEETKDGRTTYWCPIEQK